MGRTSDAKERLVESATELMHERGYGSVGVSEICARAGVNKGSFYHFFASKQTLGRDVIDAYWADSEPAWREALSGDDPPLCRLQRFLAGLHAAHAHAAGEAECVRGCLFGNLALELSNQDEALRGRLREIFAEQASYLEPVIAEAVARGDIPPTDAQRAARTVLAYIEGLVMLAKVERDPGLLADAGAEVLRLLGAPAR